MQGISTPTKAPFWGLGMKRTFAFFQFAALVCLLNSAYSQQEPPLAGESPAKAPPAKNNEENTANAPKMGNPADPPAPFVTVRVRVAAQAAINEELEYRILVENHSPAHAHQVRVRNTLPTNAKFLRSTPPADSQTQDIQWKLGTLEGGSTKEIRMTVLVLGGGDIDSCSRVQYEHGQCVRTQVATPVSMRLTAPQSAMLFDTITFQADLVNTSANEITGLTLTHLLPEGFEFLTSNPSTSGDNPIAWNSISIPAGQTKRLEFQATAKKPGEFAVQSTLKGAAGVLQETTNKILIGDIKLGITVSGPQKRGVNRPAQYLISIGNTGSQIARGVRITTRMDPSIQVLSASHNGKVENGDLTWHVSQLSPGQKLTLQGIVRGAQSGMWKNRVEIIADRVKKGVQAETSTQFENQNGLVLELDPSADQIEQVVQATLTARLVNQGKDSVKNITLSVSPPDEIDLVSTSGPTQGTKQGLQTVFAPIANLDPGQEASFTLNIKGNKSGTGKFTFDWKADNNLLGKEEISLQVGSSLLPIP